MFVSPPFPDISPKPLPAVSSPIQTAHFHTSLAIHATPYAAATKQPKRLHADEELGLPYDLIRNARTRGQFKPKHASKGTSSYQLRQFAEATLGSGSLRKVVKLPEGEDLSEWLAVNGKKTRHPPGEAADVRQSLISTIKLIFFTVLSQSSALPSHAQR